MQDKDIWKGRTVQYIVVTVLIDDVSSAQVNVKLFQEHVELLMS